MTPSALLLAVGQALYGEQWQAPLGRAIGVSDRQIRRWISGEYDPPAGVWADLERLCSERRQALAELMLYADTARVSATKA